VKKSAAVESVDRVPPSRKNTTSFARVCGTELPSTCMDNHNTSPSVLNGVESELDDLPMVMTPSEASKVLSCETVTVLRAIKAGKLPALRLNARVIRIHRNDIADFAEAKAAALVSTSSATANRHRDARGRFSAQKSQ
jgi:excisionase family DNA binding protein